VLHASLPRLYGNRDTEIWFQSNSDSWQALTGVTAALLDSDRDGIADVQHHCAGTPKQTAVKARPVRWADAAPQRGRGPIAITPGPQNAIHWSVG